MGVIRRFFLGTSLIRPVVGEPVNGEEDHWARWYRWFHYAFTFFTAIAILGALTASSIPREDGVLGSIVALTLVAWFWWRGHWKRIKTNGGTILYFVGLIILLPVALRMYDGFGLMIFAAYWQGFAYFRVPTALVYAAILTIAIQVGFSEVGPGSFDEISISPPMIFAGLFGLFVAGMMAMYMEAMGREADRRGALLTELQAAQDALATQEREAGILHERQRLAGEIHDTVAQHFTSIVTNLEAADARLNVNPAAARDHVLAARDAARQGIADTRSMVQALQPRILEGRSLSDALHEIATRDTKVTFREEGWAVPLDRIREAILVRALQESLHNIRKHAGATSVEVTLAWLEEEVILEVQDDGLGFDPEHLPTPLDGHHMGLVAMRSRVEGAGGTWSIESAPGEGTSLAVSFPLNGELQEVRNG
jgi:signal transduction histidine kinase